MKWYRLQMSKAIHITPEPPDSLDMKWTMTTATDVLVLEEESSGASNLHTELFPNKECW